MSRIRGGYRDLHVGTGQRKGNVQLDRKNRLCLLWRSRQDVDDGHHFLFDCPGIAPCQLVMLPEEFAEKGLHD